MKSFGMKKKTPYELEKERKEQRKKEEEEAAAAVYAEYIEEFNKKASDSSTTFVRGETVVPSVLYDNGEGSAQKPAKGELYTLSVGRNDAPQSSPTVSVDNAAPAKPVPGNKKKSNLELFKEQLKREQEQRELKRAAKRLRESGAQIEDPKAAAAIAAAEAVQIDDFATSQGSFAVTGDTTTTNLYLGNLDPSVDEMYICKTFGKYGPLASVKIMWPRTPDEKLRNRNCGFVAFMHRADAEVALEKLQDVKMGEHEIKLGWGKRLPIPPVPYYIDGAAELGPVYSGLPFNAIVTDSKRASREYGQVAPPGVQANATTNQQESDIRDAEVHVIIPQDVALRKLIHRMVEFVVREGAPFEAIIMSREFNNPQYRFLMDYNSPEHVYYRWKLYSILQGDSPNKWRSDRFRMYQGGSWWIPPRLPEAPTKDASAAKKRMLRSGERDEFENLLRSAAMDRASVRDIMGFCLDHCEAAEEIVECLVESLSILQTPIPVKIARLFAVSDVLHNTAVPGASFYRRGFEQQLPTIFTHLNAAYRAISGRIRAEYFKKHIMNVLNAWESWCLYPANFIAELRLTFLNLPQVLSSAAASAPDTSNAATKESVEDIDGEDIDGEDIDGEDIDGEDIDGEPIENSKPSSTAGQDKFKTSFQASKWAPVASTEDEAKRKIDSKRESEGVNEDTAEEQIHATKKAKTASDAQGSRWKAVA